VAVLLPFRVDGELNRLGEFYKFVHQRRFVPGRVIYGFSYSSSKFNERVHLLSIVKSLIK
jgi:hypothetical protein